MDFVNNNIEKTQDRIDIIDDMISNYMKSKAD